MKSARTIVNEVFGSRMVRDIWTGNYWKVLPVSLQDFELSAVLPAVFYMFRFGKRRGKGKFLEFFGQESKGATVEKIATILAQDDSFSGFDDEIKKAILGDLLLCFCLENAKHALGREQQVRRVAPTHYMASWVDLPKVVAHLRFVPEMIVAMLANQEGKYVEQTTSGKPTWFPVGSDYDSNILLEAFSQGVERLGIPDSLASDQFDEKKEDVGLDQLLMIRLALLLEYAPDPLRGKDQKISNQSPVAKKAADEFSEDIRLFVRSYSRIIPRHSFVELLESCVAVGMMTIFTSTTRILIDLADKGEISKKNDQKPAYLFIDCSNGINNSLRLQAEQSMDDFVRHIEYIPVVLMALRLLDYSARSDPKIRKLGISTEPDATDWLNMLGDLLHKRLPEYKQIFDILDRHTVNLAEDLAEDYPEAAQILTNWQNEPVWRLAESLTLLQGRKNTQGKLLSMIDSMLLAGRPNGLAAKRLKMRNIDGTTKRRREARSLVFTDSVLDYLVHRHVLRYGKEPGRRPLPLREFIRIIRDRYGFLIDVAPPGMTISNSLLQENRLILERRLRDLGLLVGVNDSESMKCLNWRFDPYAENADEEY